MHKRLDIEPNPTKSLDAELTIREMVQEHRNSYCEFFFLVLQYFYVPALKRILQLFAKSLVDVEAVRLNRTTCLIEESVAF